MGLRVFGTFVVETQLELTVRRTWEEGVEVGGVFEEIVTGFRVAEDKEEIGKEKEKIDHCFHWDF